MYDARPGLPLVYRNRRMAERQEAVPWGLDLARIEHPQLRAAAERLIETRETERLDLNLAGPDGQHLLWTWSLSPLLSVGGKVLAVLAIVEDLSQPLRARRRIETAVDQGLHLLLEVARLAEEQRGVEEFLTAVGTRVALLVQADRVVFHTYDPARKALVPSSVARGGAAHGSSPASLPCDPEASDLLPQVVFAGRVYSGVLDLASLAIRPYTHLTQFWPESGATVLIVPWRAGNERLGALVADRAQRTDTFTDENAIVLIAAGHAAGLVWQRKRAEQRLSERAAELESLERAKTDFLLLASHELRTPLTLLNGYVSMLADAGRMPGGKDEALAIVKQSLERMNVLVDQLIDATRMGDGNIRLRFRAIDLRTAVDRAVNRVVSRWGRLEDFDILLPDAMVPARVDVLRIETAVESLVDNAFKYSVPGERVRCELHLEHGTARIVVADEGIGLSEQEMVGVFARFSRMVNPRNSHIGGAGLGLFVSREIVRMHGGDITVASAPGRGSRFELRLPLGESKAAQIGMEPQ
jgi:signal transduction histidine kinase